MRNTLKILSLLIFSSIIILSCGRNKSKAKVVIPDVPTDLKYQSITLIDGPLSEYVEVVPGSYLFELKKNDSDEYLLGYQGEMKVKFKFIKPFDIKAGQSYNKYGPSLNGKALDEQGVPLDFELNDYTDKDLATYLKRGSGEEWLTVGLYSQGSANNTEEAKKMLAMFKKGKNIRFNSEIVEEKFEKGSSAQNSASDTTVNESATSTNSGNCEDFLKGYESFMNKYIDILKRYKANPKDASILSEYTSMLAEAQDWAGKTKDCANDPKFVAKFTEIQMKIANAASGL